MMAPLEPNTASHMNGVVQPAGESQGVRQRLLSGTAAQGVFAGHEGEPFVSHKATHHVAPLGPLAQRSPTWQRYSPPSTTVWLQGLFRGKGPLCLQSGLASSSSWMHVPTPAAPSTGHDS